MKMIFYAGNILCFWRETVQGRLFLWSFPFLP